MSPEVVLFLLRLLGALLLLGFLGVLGWLLYKDIKVTNAFLGYRQQRQGILRIVEGSPDTPSSSSNGKEFPLLPVTSIGRSPTNTIVLQDGFASNEHVLISLRGHRWWVEDLNSRNGTLLNDLPLESATAISTGDVITIGQTLLKIEY